MRPLEACDVLDIWERGQALSPTTRALTLLAASRPQTTWNDLIEMPIDRRDRGLLELREMTLGPSMESVAKCPECALPLEFTLRTNDLMVGGGGDAPAEIETKKGNLRLRFRLPNSADLLVVEGYAGVGQAGLMLADRCLLEARRKGEAVEIGDLTEGEIETLNKRMAEAGAQAELFLDLNCPSCGHAWRELFDIAAYFWSELAARAKRLLEDVHFLARGYGWREADILAMSAWRRQAYMEMLGS